MLSSFVHKDYFIALTKIQGEVIGVSPVCYMLEFCRSGIHIDSRYNKIGIICVFTYFITITLPLPDVDEMFMTKSQRYAKDNRTAFNCTQ